MDRKTVAPIELKMDEAGSVELAFAQLNVIDSDGDVTLPGAFPMKDVPMSAYGHTSWDGALPVGKGTITEEGDWAVFRGQFFMDTSAGRDTHATLKGLGPLAEFSYGYVVKDASFGTFDGRQVRFLRGLDPHEVSPVLKGAGVGTHLRAIKSGAPGPETPYADHLAWVSGVVKALTDRTTDRAEWRAKEGRVLSAANRTQLASVLEGIRGFTALADELEALLEATDPAKAARTRATTMEVLLAEARRVGMLP